jgi:hypothetical protein
MPELPDFLHTDNHLLWALIGVSVVMVLTLEAVQTAVEGAWPHQRRPATMLPHERTAQSIWGFAAIALIAVGLLLIANLAILLWQEIDYVDSHVIGGVLAGVAWLMVVMVGIERFGIRRYLTSIGLAAPVAVVVLLIMAGVLLALALIDIWPPADEFRDALPIITIPVRALTG